MIDGRNATETQSPERVSSDQRVMLPIELYTEERLREFDEGEAELAVVLGLGVRPD